MNKPIPPGYISLPEAGQRLNLRLRRLDQLCATLWRGKVVYGRRRKRYVPLAVVLEYLNSDRRGGMRVGWHSPRLVTRRARVRQLRANGLSIREIATTLDIPYLTAYRDVHSNESEGA